MTPGFQRKIAAGEPILAVGLMSGTSADGIDAAVVEIRPGDRPRLRLLAFESTSYNEEIRRKLFECFEDRATVRQVCLLNAAVGEAFADAALRALSGAGIAPDRLDFAASHGQTVWHEPEPEPPLSVRATFQIGEAARLAERLQVHVVRDFRQQDLALNGQGAPLVPYADFVLFAAGDEARAVQNLGGMGNVTYLPRGGDLEAVVAFDTGPANALIDAAVRLDTEGAESYDQDGQLAASAAPDERLLQELLAHPYFDRPPPRSTGRELFGEAMVRGLWERGHRGAPLISTLTEFTVRSVADSYRRWLGPVSAVILGGGGVRNAELVRRLEHALAPAQVRRHEDFGIDSDAKEALAFALLGYETLSGRPSNVPSATGARRPAILGKICLP
jgi:anhydro-N-acetylmuramic acid kinase